MKGALIVASLSLIGFGVGYGIGRETRDATPSNVKADYDGGKVTITADLKTALTQGVEQYLAKIF